MTLAIPPEANKRKFLKETAADHLKRAHKCQEKSLKVKFSAKTLCAWYNDVHTSAGKQRAEREIDTVRSHLESAFVDGLALLPRTVDASLCLQRSETILQYIHRLNHDRIQSQYLQQKHSSAPPAAPPVSTPLTSVLCPLYAPGCSQKRHTEFASSTASFAATIGSNEGTPPALREVGISLLRGEAGSELKSAVVESTTTRKYVAVEDRHRCIELARLHAGRALVYSCDSKIIKTKNFEVQLVSSYNESEDRIVRQVLGAVQLSDGTGAEHDHAKELGFARQQFGDVGLNESAVEMIASDKAAVMTSGSAEFIAEGKNLVDRTRARLNKPLTMSVPCLSHATDNEWSDCLLAMAGVFEDRCVFVSCVDVI